MTRNGVEPARNDHDLARSYAWVFLCLMFTLLVARPMVQAVESEQCDPRLRPLPGHLGYIWRGDRCEGLYLSPVAANDLELVSLLQGKLHFDLQPKTRLQVSAPPIADIAQGPVHIRAVALPLRTYYRMDASLLPGSQFNWSVDSVLVPNGLSANHLGVFGWINIQPEKIFVPLQVLQHGQPQPQGPVELVVRSSVDIENLVWRSSVEGEPTFGPPKWLEEVATPLPGGRPVPIYLPTGPRAVLRVEVAAKARESDQWSLLSIRMIRPSSP
jgi:hypothetical protein